jgi:UDP-N-acetylglucosamine:LPS N-acetylglucosamine transferase
MTIRTAPATNEPLLTTRSGGQALRIAVVTGSYGSGHNAAARELAVALRGIGCQVEIHDIVDLLPWRLGRILRSAYYGQLRWHPRSWGATLRLLEPGRPLHRLVTRSLGFAAAPVAAAAYECDLVITTHPFGAQALGHARATGQLDCPAVTYFTDASVHSLWVHPGIDLNLAIHKVAADDARQWNVEATVIAPLVPLPAPGHDSTLVPDPLAAQNITGPRALVTGGSLGIGNLEETCRDILATGVMTPVAVCGTDEAHVRRLRRIPGVVALGWRDDVENLMASSACIVQNAGGFSSLEALASGTPVVTYRPIPGHGEANSVNLEKAGLAPWARTRSELAVMLAAATHAPRVDRLPAGAPDVVTLLTGQCAMTTAA